jgi:putative membrane protein
MSLVNGDGIEKIEAAIARAEAETSTELVVAVVSRSGDYWQGPAAVAWLWTLAVACGLLYFFPTLDPFIVVVLQLPVPAALFWVIRRPRLLRLLISRAAAAENVERRAFSLFSERGLYETRDRSGMLILVSELEHRVVILGDRGIHEHVGAEGWRAHVDHILASIRRGDAAGGIVEVIERLGALHAERMPVRADDTNELANAVIRD